MNLLFFAAFFGVLWLIVGAWFIVEAIVEWFLPSEEFDSQGRERLGL